MKIGLRLPGAGPWAGPDAIERICHHAEELGFDSLWMTDHIALPSTIDTPYPYSPTGKFLWPSDTPYLETLTALTWAAAATERVELGTSILVLTWRPLIQTAKSLVSIDVLSGGRLNVAVGVGWMKEQFEVLGYDFKNRGPRLTEEIRALKHMWEVDDVDFTGEFHDLHGFKIYPKPVRAGGIPIWCAGYAEKPLRRVAEVGDGWHPLSLGPEDYAKRLERLTELLEEQGRSLDDITLTARPFRAAPFTPETLEAYHDLGVVHVVLDTSFEHPTLEQALEELDQLAEDLLPVAHRMGAPAR